MSETIFLTREGHAKLVKQLKVLKGAKRREIANALAKARAMGDLSENAEYDAAKQDQAINEKRISELEQKLINARLIEEENIPKDKAYIGATIKLVDIESKEEISYTLVSEDEADFAQGKISTSSPVGKALLGKKKDEIVHIRIPAGTLKYKVTSITR
ncbi:MAG: transcription elongation factor GreA [Candidatus Gorgyraea atricola]|nr:transcription elongation factor GreA [Candidatus Gorgyraea atricola]